jgi:ferredoxin
MPTVVMNDSKVEAQIGEVLLNVARREAAHIGFVCDGNGLCQTCECRVVQGAQHLNPPNEVERIWLTDEQLEEGRRLACQASVRGPGPIEVETRAEEFRRYIQDIFSPPPESNAGENVGRFLNRMVQINVDHVRRWPSNMFYAISNIFSIPFTVAHARTLVNDTWRITQSLTNLGETTMPETEQQPARLPAEAQPRLSAPAAAPAPAAKPAPPASESKPQPPGAERKPEPASTEEPEPPNESGSSQQPPAGGRRPPRSSRK